MIERLDKNKIQFEVTTEENLHVAYRSEDDYIVFIESFDNTVFELYAGPVLRPVLITTIHADSETELNHKLTEAYTSFSRIT